VTALKGNTKAVTGDGTYVDVETLISSGMTVIGGPLSGWILPGGEDDHTHRIYDHRHHITHEHEIEIPDHRHSFEIPDHTHDIDYGIYEGPTPTVITVQVDGNTVPGLGTSGTDIDIIPYLAKDNEGKITRGTWHEIKITPNNLGRVVASVVVQLFVQSRGGGSF